MARSFVTVFDDKILESADVSKAVDDTARSILKAANKNTTAPAGFVPNRIDTNTVRLTSRGAAAVPREVGTRFKSAGRPMKRALDAHEVS